MFKAKIAARDRHRTKAKFQPPTVEAVRTTVMKLTAMAEKKNKDVDVLEEKLRRVRLGNRSRSMSATPGRHETPERELVTPAQRAGRYGTVAPTPVLALIEEGDVDELREEQKRRREAVRKLRGALQSRGGRLTDGGNN
jgi:nucleoporin NUP159